MTTLNIERGHELVMYCSDTSLCHLINVGVKHFCPVVHQYTLEHPPLQFLETPPYVYNNGLVYLHSTMSVVRRPWVLLAISTVSE